MIKKIRVDHRLLHGQVAFSWVHALGVDCIVIANDKILKDQMALMAIKMAKPVGVKLVVKSIDDFIDSAKSGITDKYKMFVITENIVDACKIAEALGIQKINLGGTKAQPEKRQISQAIFLTNDEEELIMDMVTKGIVFEVQMVPGDKVTNVKELL